MAIDRNLWTWPISSALGEIKSIHISREGNSDVSQEWLCQRPAALWKTLIIDPVAFSLREAFARMGLEAVI
jgi:hypothetical protein